MTANELAIGKARTHVSASVWVKCGGPDATSGEVKRLGEENEQLKRAVAESALDVQRLKKHWACKLAKV